MRRPPKPSTRLRRRASFAGTKVAELYDALGVQFYNAKQYDLAASSFQKAAALNPSNPEAQKMLAEALNSQGKRAEARGSPSKGDRDECCGRRQGR